jgi:uncharacterized membrane protein YqaE (UPF0057 family)
MLYLLATLVPPLAVLFCGKPFQALLNLIACVTLVGWIPGIIHACFVVSSHHAGQRNQRLIDAIGRQGR